MRSMSTQPDPTIPPWVRLAFVALGLPTLFTGVWAIVSPQGWFDDFPGWDPRLVAALPPYNEHLATDAGAGLFASGVVLLAAAWFATRPAMKVGLLSYAAFTIPHTAWHVLNPADALTGSEDLVNSASLVFSVVAAVGLYVVVNRPADRRGPSVAPRDLETAS